MQVDLNFCHDFAIFGKCGCHNVTDEFHRVNLMLIAEKRAYSRLFKHAEPLYDLYDLKDYLEIEDAIKVIKISEYLIFGYIRIGAHKAEKRCFERSVELLRWLYHGDDLYLSKRDRNHFKTILVNTLLEYGKFIGNRLSTQSEKRLKNMKQIFDEAINLDPKNTKLYFYYGTWLSKKQKYDQALLMLKKCIDINMEQKTPRAESYYHYSFCLTRIRKNEESIAMFEIGERLLNYGSDSSSPVDPLTVPMLYSIAFWIKRKREERDYNN